MGETRIDVNDAALRDGFLRHEVGATLARLSADTPALWGRMTAQQMIEHLLWAVELSTGRARTECPLPEAEQGRMKRFLHSNHPTPQEFMNPALVSGLPPLRFAGLDQAKAALGQELERFLREPENADLRIHPIFGPIGHEQWHRAHYKHLRHHFMQFGLIEPESDPSRLA